MLFVGEETLDVLSKDSAKSTPPMNNPKLSGTFSFRDLKRYLHYLKVKVQSFIQLAFFFRSDLEFMYVLWNIEAFLVRKLDRKTKYSIQSGEKLSGS